MINIIFNTEYHGYRFDVTCSALVLFMWLKFLYCFKYTSTFGPIFKMTEQMTIDLVRLMTIWCLLLIIFTCVSLLSFGQLETFSDPFRAFVYFFEVS